MLKEQHKPTSKFKERTNFETCRLGHRVSMGHFHTVAANVLLIDRSRHIQFLKDHNTELNSRLNILTILYKTPDLVYENSLNSGMANKVPQTYQQIHRTQLSQEIVTG